MAFLLLSLLLERSTVLGTTTETGDFAADSLRSQHAWSQVDGVFSRWGYHHPGPALLWIKDLSEAVLTPAGLDPTGAQVVGTAVLATLSLIALGLALSGPGSSPWTGPAVMTLALVGLPDGLVLVPWGPMVGNWFVLLGVAGVAATSRGARRGIPVGVGGALGLVHVHVLFIPVAAAVVASLLLVARRGGRGHAVRRRHPAVLVTGAVLALGLAPMVVAVSRGSSPWGDYLRVSGSRAASPTASPWIDGLLRVGSLYTPALGAPSVVLRGSSALLFVAVVVSSLWLALRGSHAAPRVVGAAGLVGTAFLLAVCRMDFLTPETIGRAFPVLILAGVVAELGGRARHRSRVPVALPMATAIGVAVLVVVNVGRPPVDVVRREGALRGSGAAEAALADFRRSGAALLVVDHATTPWTSYGGAASLAALAQRNDVPYCVAVRRMPLWAEPSTICPRRTPTSSFHVYFTAPDAYRVGPVGR